MIAYLWQSWRSLRRPELWALPLFVLIMGVDDLGPLIDFNEQQNWSGLLAHWTVLSLQGWVVLLCWLPADRSAVAHPMRSWRMLAGCLSGAMAASWLAAVLVSYLSAHWPGLNPEVCSLCSPLERYRLSGLNLVGDSLQILLSTGLLAAVHELYQRRTASQAALQQILEAQQQQRRLDVDARLQALHTQIDPQFVHDALQTIEQGYLATLPGHSERASLQLAQLIDYLRMALPRLRESCRQLDEEVQLLRCYLALHNALHQTGIVLTSNWTLDFGATPVVPGMLLPFVRQALSGCTVPPRHCRLHARPGLSGVVMTIDLDGFQQSIEIAR
ncbi:histidine kinase [Chitinimonas sp.]|uniref:histidine kinase n=1 Tax=Chitinimonas sp. TaxID=1934313 RepID=UPI0035B22CBC